MPFKAIHRFLSSEAQGGIILFGAALAAFILSNSSAVSYYDSLLNTPRELAIANYVTSHSLLNLINEGLMTFFFLLVGLELKRECLIGHLSELRKTLLPGVAALGGMFVPALLYIGIAWHHQIALHGWAIPVATDIAFALGVLSLFGKHIPLGLRLFLMTLAIVDDVGAILIIALFQSHELSSIYLLFSLAILMFLVCLNRANVQHLAVYLIVGVLLWVCVLHSGIHATITGVLLAFVIPLKPSRDSASPLERLEKFLQPWVAYVVVPLFAFANAGLSLHGLTFRVLLDPITLGIVAGLFIGKQVGVFGFTWFMVRMKWAKLPERVSWLQVYGVALLCGIGFTMSLFIGMLAFQGEPGVYLVKVKAGVLMASLLSGLMGAGVLGFAALERSKK